MKGISWDITEKTDLETAVVEVLERINGLVEDESAVLALHGDLGAGKTTFVQILAKKLGVEETVTSPTFVIMKSYSTQNKLWTSLVHIDAYRIEDTEEMKVLGLEDKMAQAGNIVCIEWAERVAELLPSNTINLFFSQTGDKRELTLDSK